MHCKHIVVLDTVLKQIRGYISSESLVLTCTFALLPLHKVLNVGSQAFLQSYVHLGVIFVFVKAKDVVDKCEGDMQLALCNNFTKLRRVRVEVLVLVLEEFLVIVKEAVELG